MFYPAKARLGGEIRRKNVLSFKKTLTVVRRSIKLSASQRDCSCFVALLGRFLP
jgi:hypothetical protein